VGRPARAPKVMTIALILQQHNNLSDRQMSEATRYDLNVKAALGLT
jgi:transposase